MGSPSLKRTASSPSSEPLVRHSVFVPEKTVPKPLSVLGSNLRQLRNSAHLSQDALALKADVTKRYIQMMEAGQKCPTLYTLKRLKIALRCSYEDLLAGF